MKTLKKLLIGVGLTIAGALGINYTTNAQYTDELYWKYHNKLPSNSTNQTNCYQSPSEKRETKKKIKKAFKTNDWLENHTHEFTYGNMNQDANPFTFRTDPICGTEYIWDAQGSQTYIAPKNEVDISLSASEKGKAVWRKKYQVKPLKDDIGRTITQVRAKNIKLNPKECSGIYNEDDFARNYNTKTINGITYIPTCISESEIKDITKNLEEGVLPLLLVPLDAFFGQTISGENGEVLLTNTNGIMYATTNIDKIQKTQPVIVKPTQNNYITPISTQSAGTPNLMTDSISDSKNNKKVTPAINKTSKINYWVIKKGENYHDIAKQTNTPLDSLVKWNNLTDKARKGNTLKTNPYVPRSNLRKK